MYKVGILCLGLMGSSLMAQNTHTISGKIKELASGEFIAAADIYLENTEYEAVSNDYGYYVLKAPSGSYNLIVEYYGFKTKEQNIELNANRKININLESEADNTVEEVVYSSNKKHVSLKNPQMSVHKLTAKTIKEVPALMGEVDILKTIQLLPGVSSAGEGKGGFNVRGGASDQNLVLLDEAVIYNTSHLFGMFSVFNNDAVKDLKLYKGGIPSKYGGRISSVLDIRQKDGNSKEFHVNGGVGLISSRLLAEGPLVKDRGSFLVAGRTSYINLFLKLFKNENRASFYDLNTKLSYRLNDDNKLYLSGYFGRDNFKLGDVFDNDYGNTSFNLRWNHIFGESLFSNLSMVYSKYKYNFAFDLLEFKWDSNIKNYNIKYDFNYYRNKNMKVNFGITSTWYDFSPGIVSPTTDESPIENYNLDTKIAVEPAAYIDVEHEVNPKLTLRYGLRQSYFLRLGPQNVSLYKNNQPVVYNADLDIYEKGEKIGEKQYTKNDIIANFSGLEPRFSLSYKLGEQNSTKFSYQRMNQYLHLISNTNGATPLDIWTPSGEYMKPQISDQLAVGYFHNFKDNKYSLEAETYYKTVKNRVDYIDGADLIANNNIETEILSGKMRSYGLELMFRKNTGRLKGWISYTLSKAEQKVEGRTPQESGINNGNWYNSNHDKTHDLSITTTYKLTDKWSFAGNFVFQTGQPTTYPVSQYSYDDFNLAAYAPRNSNRLTNYHRLDLSATYKPSNTKNKKFKGEWVFGVYNAYNRKNAASLSFTQNEDTGENQATRLSIFGIIPSVTYNFKF